MKITAGNLGALSYAIQTSFLDLGIEMILPPLSNHVSAELGEENLKAEICHPLKILLGNFLTLKDLKPEKVIFYTGCDLCNLPASSNVFLDIFSKYSWNPEPYYFNVARKNQFIKDYYNNLKEISGASNFEIIRAILSGYTKFTLFEHLDKVFYLIRPSIKDSNIGEKLYSCFFEEIRKASSFLEYKKIKCDINTLLKSYPPNHNLPHIGLIGDPFSLMEPYLHQYTDRKLGYLDVIADRWVKNKLIKRKTSNNFNLKDIVKNNYGVLTDQEFRKINQYVRKSYDGLIFIAPFSCNPNDALRNQLSTIQEKTGIPILSLVFDSHTSSTGLESRLEAFTDLLYRKNRSGLKIYSSNHQIKLAKF